MSDRERGISQEDEKMYRDLAQNPATRNAAFVVHGLELIFPTFSRGSDEFLESPAARIVRASYNLKNGELSPGAPLDLSIPTMAVDSASKEPAA